MICNRFERGEAAPGGEDAMLFPRAGPREGTKEALGRIFFYRVFVCGSCYPLSESEGQYFLGLLLNP